CHFLLDGGRALVIDILYRPLQLVLRVGRGGELLVGDRDRPHLAVPEQVLVDLPLVEAPAQLDRLVGPSGKGKDKKRETGQDCSHGTDLLETKSGGKASKRVAAFPGPRGGVTMVDVIIPVAGREARYHAACPGSRHVPVPPVAIVESDRAVPDAA